MLRTSRPRAVRSRNERLILGALWLAFIGLPIRAFGVESDLLRNVGRFVIDIAGGLMIVAGLLSLQPVRRTPLRGAVPLYTLFAICILAAGMGLARGSAIMYWVLLGVLPFMSMLVVFALPQDPEFRERLLSTLVQQTVIAVIFAAYVIVFEPISSRGIWNGENGDGMGKLAARCLYALPFLLGSLRRLKMWHVYLSATAWLELTVLGVLGASRGVMTITLVLLPVFLIILGVRNRAPIGRLVRPLVAATIILATAIAVLYAGRRSDEMRAYLDERWEQAVGRLTGAAPEELTIRVASSGALDSAKREFLEGESRGGEFRDFLSQMTPTDYLIGRGFGGTWMSSFWRTEWLMVHIGPGHLLLIGGLPLLLSFCWFLSTAATCAWRSMAHDAFSAGAFLYLMIFVQNFLQHGAMQDEIEVYFFWVCAGIGLVTPVRCVSTFALRGRSAAA